jgi:transcriptional regulator with XRE-family HTH domain
MRNDRDAAMAERIKAAMPQAELNMKKLAERSGVRYGVLRSYLSGARSMPARLVPDVARALGVSCDWLLTGEPAALHPYPLLLAVDDLEKLIRARPDDGNPPPVQDFAANLYLTYRRHYLARFADGSIGVSMYQDGPPDFLRRLYKK